MQSKLGFVSSISAGHGTQTAVSGTRSHLHAPLPTYLSCVSPAVTPLLQCPVSFLQLLFEPGGLCTGSRGQQGRRCTRRPLA